MDAFFITIAVLFVAFFAGMIVFDARRRKAARREWFANRTGEFDLGCEDDPVADAIVKFVAESADVPADLLRAGDGIDVLFDIGLDDEDLFPFIKRTFRMKLKQDEVCPLINTDTGWRAHPITLGALIERVRAKVRERPMNHSAQTPLVRRLMHWRGKSSESYTNVGRS